MELPPDAFAAGPRCAGARATPYRLVSIGGLDQLYKGIDTLIHALSRLGTHRTPAPHLTHIGDGRQRVELEQLAQRVGVSTHLTFTGALPGGAAVRRHLDDADLFVLPSRTEGLPRALVEAMARALPAIATRVGGVPELLPPEHLVPPDDPIALAAAISRILDDPTRMAAASAANLTRARDYAAETLAVRRDAFYRAVRDAHGGRPGAR